jgi:hypothetical protein
MISWKQRIALARKRGSFDEEDRKLAKNWLTCAISERPTAKSERSVFENLQPKNSELFNLGNEFYWDAIYSNNFDKAEKLLKQIKEFKE